MRLDSSLKLYIALYVLCFLLTWLVSVPMLVHVTPQSECLLFVTPYVQYGSPVTCQVVGFLPILVAIATIVLIVLLVVQLRSLYAFLRKPGPHLSDYHQRPTHIFWRMVVFHGIVTLVVIAIAAIVTSGYATTCQNLYRDVSQVVRSRVKVDLWGGGEGANEHYDKFANDRSIDRYTNRNRDMYGESNMVSSITCRNILTDPEIHHQLKQKHKVNPYYATYFGSYFGNDYSDVGNIRFYAYRNNTILELCIAGSWISVIVWSVILVLMCFERKFLDRHEGDVSVLGDPRISSSRMSNHSFDKMSGSRYSNYSGSNMSGSRRGGRKPNYNGSYQGSVQGSLRNGTPQRPSQHHRPSPHHQSAHPHGNGHHSMGLDTKQVEQNNLLNYFAQNPPLEEEVDIDAALEDQDLQDGLGPNDAVAPPELNVDILVTPKYEMHQQNYVGTQFESKIIRLDHSDTNILDQSFDLPIVDTTEGYGDPFPLGDEVSSGHLRQAPNPPQQQYQQYPPPQPQQPVPQQPYRQGGRVTGRRGNRANAYPSPNNYNPIPRMNYNPQDSLELQVEPPQQQLQQKLQQLQQQQQQQIHPQNDFALDNTDYEINQSGYRTKLGNQSRI